MIAQRIKTGFHRAGVLVAVLFPISGVISLWSWLYWGTPSGLGQGIAFFVVAVAVYALLRAIGWVAAGFAGDK